MGLLPTTLSVSDEVLPQRWIGRGSLYLPAAIEWPPRSPDLTSCDNSLWGIIKQKVLKQRYQAVEELQKAVREAFREITRLFFGKSHTGPGAASLCAVTMMVPILIFWITKQA
ncbi:hypothetical protein C0J52_05385 [Blattella germanica]|nr:hypothetical protein C0J52_05385 [Blattella germanica]